MNLYDIRNNLNKEMEKEFIRLENAIDEYTHLTCEENLEYLNEELNKVNVDIWNLENRGL